MIKRWSTYIIGGILLSSILASLFMGAVNLKLKDIVNGSPIFWEIRVPRVINAFSVGAGLSISGAVLQAIFRNPLADPYLLGISSGAAVGASVGILLGLSWGVGGCSFVGALLSLFFVYRIALREGFLSTEGLLLAGVAVNALLSAVLGFLLYLVGRSIHGVLFWLWGNLSLSSWETLLKVLPLIILSTLVILRYSDELNVMLWGDEHAVQMGVDISKVKKIVIVFASLATASSVASSGIIGFVGLVIPHMVRISLGPDHKTLLPASAILGGAVLVLADLLARELISPAEIPVGIITALGGAPFFIFLLKKHYGRDTQG
ncbi:MAG: iron chelate uptake ABC transporter family permease subunit [Synergistetes bacterium]|nr:iron chelate uptake ABC transporter family permease subunit [Synergistota bacterium]